MPRRELETPNDLRELVGQEVAVTDWLEVTQARIEQFAEATGDQQWIHTDVERCRTESPYGTTIAHGFLTLSLLSHLMAKAITFRSGLKHAINYGLNRVRFSAPVPAASKIRARVTLASIADIAGGFQATWSINTEREGSDKPVCVAEWVVRYYV